MTIEYRYAVPLLGLSALVVGFFRTHAFRSLSPRVSLGLRVAAALPLLGSGALHILRPALYLPLMPPPFPRESWVIVVTGIPELLGAVGLFVPATRRAAAVSLAIYMVAIFPANVYVAGRTIGGLPMPSVPVRTAMQAGYILLLLVSGWGLPRYFRHPRTQPHP